MPTIERILPQHIDSTMISAFRACPRKFYHEFILGLRTSSVNINLYAGGCFASALDVLYNKVFYEQTSQEEALKWAMHKLLVEWGDRPLEVKGNPKTRDRMTEALMDYVRTYPPRTDHVQPFIMANGKPSVEFTFAIPLLPDDGFPLHPSGEPFIYCGRFDLLGLYMGKKLVVKDDKVTKEAGPSWPNQWALRSQFMGYVWGCQQSGLDLDHVIVRGVVVQVKQIRQLEADKYFPPFMIDRWYAQLRRDLHAIVRMWNEDEFDYNLAESCTSFGGCMFQDLCLSADPTPWMSTFTVNRWNPLHRDPLEEPKI